MVKFEEIKIGNVVGVRDEYYGGYAVGIVKKKTETAEFKEIGVQFGFDDELSDFIVEFIEQQEGEQTCFVDKIIAEHV